MDKWYTEVTSAIRDSEHTCALMRCLAISFIETGNPVVAARLNNFTSAIEFCLDRISHANSALVIEEFDASMEAMITMLPKIITELVKE